MTDPSDRASADAPPRRLGDLGTRALSGLVLIAIAVGSAELGGEVFILVWLVAAIAVLWEWQRLIGGAAPRWRVWVGAATLVLVAIYARVDLLGASLALIAASIVLAILSGSGRRVWASAGMLYAGLLLLATIGLRFSFPFGIRSILWLFATVWTTDTFAYLGGRLIGGPKLFPRISPSKTWSGTASGLAAGALVGTFVAVRGLPPPVPVLPIFLVSLVAACVSQTGDAFESAIKRHFNVKDSSRLIPGHGGVMDRLDGFIAAAVFAFALGVARNLPTIAGGLFYWA